MFTSIQEANSIEEVVSMINEYSATAEAEDKKSANRLAAEYAVDAAASSDYEIDESQLSYQLSELSNFGAIFDATIALLLAQSISSQI